MKNAPAHNADQSARTAQSYTARELRLLSALMDRGPTSRHDLDRLIGAENTPDVVMRMRRRHGLVIDMQKRPFIDRDGKTVRVGYYSLTEQDLKKVRSHGHAPEEA